MERMLERTNMDKWLRNSRVLYASDTINVNGVKKNIKFYVRLGPHVYGYEVDVNNVNKYTTSEKSAAIGYYNKLIKG